MATKRNTKQKKTIEDNLVASTAHPTAEELFGVVREYLPSVSLGTVYRNLEEMVRTGRAQKIPSPDGPARYDGRVAPHCHVRCVECGRLDDLPMEMDSSMVEEARALSRFRIDSCVVEFRGVCRACMQKKEGSGAV